MKIKTIIASVSAVLLVTAMSVAALWASHVPSDTVCQQVEIVLRDSAAHQFVTTAELLRTLQQAGLSPRVRRWTRSPVKPSKTGCCSTIWCERQNVTSRLQEQSSWK